VSTPFATDADIDRIVGANHHDPFEILGMHPVWHERAQRIVVRCFPPEAKTVDILDARGENPSGELERKHNDGFFEGILSDVETTFSYRLRITNHDGDRYTIIDPYSFPPVLTEFDLHLFGEGSHQNLFDKLGAQVVEHEDCPGVTFSVWAPAAQRVSVIGDFNAWDGRCHPMRARGASGIWEIFIPGLSAGTLYKFEVKGGDNQIQAKTDPFAKRMELRPPSSTPLTNRFGRTRPGLTSDPNPTQSKNRYRSMSSIPVRGDVSPKKGTVR